VEVHARVIDELHFKSMDEVFRRIDNRMWVARGKPRLWVPILEERGISVWWDAAYGWVRLKTQEGTGEGEGTASVGEVAATYREGKIGLMIDNGDKEGGSTHERLLKFPAESRP
jgi:hypothetical protein